MSDVDRDVRTLLEAKAEEMRLGPEIPGGVVKRARRRRVVTAALAGTVTLAAAVGFYAGARALLDETPVPPPADEVQPAGQSASAPIWPTSEEEIRNIQAQVAEGHTPLWQSPEGVAQMYAVNVLGWNPADVEIRVAGDQPVTATVANPVFTQNVGVDGDARTVLTMTRIPNNGAGIYVVTRAEAEGILLESPTPSDSVVPGGTISFSGSSSLVSIVPEVDAALTLDVAVRWEDGSAGTEVANPRAFHLDFLLPGHIESSPIITVNVRADRFVLATTEFRLPLSDGTAAALPTAVTATRDAIEEAARLRDWQALERLIPETGFTYTFGIDSDPIAYWQSLEQDGEAVLDILATLLELAPGRFGRTYIWPAPAAENVEGWDQDDLDVLSLTSSESDIRLYQRLGLYVGWRVGIEPDGTWVFFVAGD